jgi:hypothetical protein
VKQERILVIIRISVKNVKQESTLLQVEVVNVPHAPLESTRVRDPHLVNHATLESTKTKKVRVNVFGVLMTRLQHKQIRISPVRNVKLESTQQTVLNAMARAWKTTITSTASNASSAETVSF